MRFELQLQRAVQTHCLLQVVTPPPVDPLHQIAADARGLLVPMGAPQPDKGRVGVAVNYRVTLGFDQLPGGAHDFVAAHGDGRGQARVEKPATAGAEHTIKGVHDDFQCLGERLVVLTLGRLPALPHPLDNRRQAMACT
ncbi:hypothetical protein D3C81_1426410 [compost metagenome]